MQHLISDDIQKERVDIASTTEVVVVHVLKK